MSKIVISGPRLPQCSTRTNGPHISIYALCGPRLRKHQQMHPGTNRINYKSKTGRTVYTHRAACEPELLWHQGVLDSACNLFCQQHRSESTYRTQRLHAAEPPKPHETRTYAGKAIRQYWGWGGVGGGVGWGGGGEFLRPRPCRRPPFNRQLLTG